MDYMLYPSLERLATVNIAFNLWKQPAIITQIDFLITYYGPEKCSDEGLKNIEEQVLANVETLQIPKTTRDLIKGAIDPVWQQMIKCYKLIYPKARDFKSYADSIQWTVYGTINTKRTLEAFICDERLKPLWRCKMACKNCYSAYSSRLWGQLSQSEKTRLVNRIVLQPEFKYRAYIELYFLSNGLGNESLLPKLRGIIDNRLGQSLPECLTEAAIGANNVVAFQYFWEKLTEAEKSANVMKFACVTENHYPSSIGYWLDIRWFLFSKLTLKQQVFVLPLFGLPLLKSLLQDWYRRDRFVSTAKLMWHRFSYSDYHDLIVNIKSKIVESDFESDKYKIIFKEFWNASPIDFQKQLVNEDWNVLLDAMDEEGLESAKVISKDWPAVLRKVTVTSKEGMTSSEVLILREKLKLVAMFSGHMVNSEVEVNEFKNDLVKLKGEDLCRRLIFEGKFQWMVEFVEWVFSHCESEIAKFKKEVLIDRNGCEICSRLIAEDQLDLLKELVEWLFPCKEDIEKFKSDLISDRESWLLRDLSEPSEVYTFMDKFLLWALPSVEAVEDFKKSFALRKGKYYCWRLIENNISIADFLKWSFPDKAEEVAFKKEVLLAYDCESGDRSIFVELLGKNEVTIANEVLSGCFVCKEEEMKYKKSLMYSVCMFDLLVLLLNNDSLSMRFGGYNYDREVDTMELVLRIVDWVGLNVVESGEFKKYFERNNPKKCKSDRYLRFFRCLCDESAS